MAVKFKKVILKLRRNLMRPNLFFQRATLGLAKALHVRPPCLFVASMNQSGSTALASYLSEATGYPTFFLGDSYNSDQPLSLGRVADSYWFPHVVHQHSDATKHTIKTLTDRGVRPVFLHRNIFDICVSIADKLEKDPWLTPSYAVSQDFLNLPREMRIDGVIDTALHRMVLKYVSWWEVRRCGSLPVLMVSYEDLMKDKVGVIESVLEHFEILQKRSLIEDAIDAVDGVRQTRFNKGISGRGAAELSPSQKERVQRLAAPYPWVDFSPIGLNPPTEGAPILAAPLQTPTND